MKIWNAVALQASPEQVTDSLLATLEFHTKSVNVCRWSPEGNFLASGSDDTDILIYIHTPHVISTQLFGSKSAKNKVRK